jgi:hypothetical protein
MPRYSSEPKKKHNCGALIPSGKSIHAAIWRRLI